MKTANEELLDALVRHQIYLLRYSGYVRNRINSILSESEEELARRIRDKLRDLHGLSTPSEWQRLSDLKVALSNIRSDAWSNATVILDEEMTQLSYTEAQAVQTIISTTAPVVLATVLPDARMLKSIALARPFEGRILKEWAQTMEAEDIRRIHAAVQMGMIAGEDAATIARRVVGTKALMGSDGVTEMTRRQVQAVIRTAVQHVTANCRDAFYQENDDIILAERFVATLDSRTTPVCRANDGKEFPLGKGPRPPLHFQCRSLRVPAIDGTLAGERPMKPTTEKMLLREYAEKNGIDPVTSRKHLPRGTKWDFDEFARKRVRELVGTVPSSTTYEAWLRGQSTEFQDDVMGITKAKLFRAGGLPLTKFVNRTGDELTLHELARKEADAFRAAGLDPSKY